MLIDSWNSEAAAFIHIEVFDKSSFQLKVKATKQNFFFYEFFLKSDVTNTPTSLIDLSWFQKMYLDNVKHTNPFKNIYLI